MSNELEGSAFEEWLEQQDKDYTDQAEAWEDFQRYISDLEDDNWERNYGDGREL